MNGVASAHVTVDKSSARAGVMSRLKTRVQHYPMKNSLFAGQRTALLAATQSRVLELCYDPDKNSPYYSPWVTSLALVCLDGVPRDPRGDANDRGMPIERIFPGSEITTLPFEDASFDWVVTTLTLCRMKNPQTILVEIRRVLKPSGGYLFLEHGRSPDASMRRWQSRCKNLWMEIGGCDIDLEIGAMIADAGLHLKKFDQYQLGHPKFLSTMCRGMACREDNAASKGRE
jgi:SAM-dependent methyltransferase